MRIETTIETLMRTATLHRLLVTRITRPAQRFRSKEEWGVGVTLYQRRSEGSTHHTAAAAPTLFGSCSGLEGYGTREKVSSVYTTFCLLSYLVLRHALLQGNRQDSIDTV
jgi:hypothetical protein